MIRESKKSRALSAIIGFLVFSAGSADAAGVFGNQSLYGNYVISADGGFVALTPFNPEPIRLSVGMVGRLTFDGNGSVRGNWTISFHNAAVPVGIRSRFETVGSYEIAADGHMFMEFEEFKIEPPASDDGIADGIVGFECYVLQRQQEARCLLNTLVSLVQGPDPVPEPVTLSGMLQRQR